MSVITMSAIRKGWVRLGSQRCIQLRGKVIGHHTPLSPGLVASLSDVLLMLLMKFIPVFGHWLNYDKNILILCETEFKHMNSVSVVETPMQCCQCLDHTAVGSRFIYIVGVNIISKTKRSTTTTASLNMWRGSPPLRCHPHQCSASNWHEGGDTAVRLYDMARCDMRCL